MRFKIKKDVHGWWMAGIYSGHGISSLVNARHSKSLWNAIRVFFRLRNYLYIIKYRKL
jgi:hypothetical protein